MASRLYSAFEASPLEYPHEPTVKDYLTVELVRNPYKFESGTTRIAWGATGKDCLLVQMRDWIARLDDFPRLSDREILTHTGKILHKLAEELARSQFAEYEEQRRQLEASQPTSDFDQTVEHIKKLEVPKPKRVRKGERE